MRFDENQIKRLLKMQISAMLKKIIATLQPISKPAITDEVSFIK